MAKYRKKPIVVDAEIFTLGMEDGYASYGVFGGEFHGFFHKDEALPRNGLKPAIRTLEGWYEVEEGKHYIVTGVRGERYPVEKGIFEEMYDLVYETCLPPKEYVLSKKDTEKMNDIVSNIMESVDVIDPREGTLKIPSSGRVLKTDEDDK